MSENRGLTPIYSKHYSELTEKQVREMWSRCVDAAVAYAKEINMSGLSQAGSHNVYNALEHAVFSEWENAKLAEEMTPNAKIKRG